MLPNPSFEAARRVAIVHDYFTQHGGAERVAGELAALLPGSRVHAAVYDPDKVPPAVVAAGVRATPLQRLRARCLPLAAFAPVLPWAFGRMDLDGASVVLSSTSAFAHHARPPAGAIHVAYCHTPPHFLWEADEYFRGRATLRRVLAPALAVLRRADVDAARRVDAYLANSHYTARRIRDDYGIDATVVYPPVDTSSFRPSAERSGRFLCVARLRRHKRLELAIEAANRLGARLDVIGEGPDRLALQALAGPTVRFLGRIPDEDVRAAMARCTALIVPGVEDFGLTTAEVQAAGRPPVAFARGGALEIVRDGATGFLFRDQDVEALIEALRRAERTALDRDVLVASAVRFDRTRFAGELRAVLARVTADGRMPAATSAPTERPAEAPPGAAASD